MIDPHDCGRQKEFGCLAVFPCQPVSASEGHVCLLLQQAIDHIGAVYYVYIIVSHDKIAGCLSAWGCLTITCIC